MLRRSGSLFLAIVIAGCAAPGQRDDNANFALGTTPTDSELRVADDDVTPTGHGLPHDSGTIAEGEVVYKTKCIGCHGPNGNDGPFDKLVGRIPGDSFPWGRDQKDLPDRTIGNYWPYATTVYDYVHR